MSIAWLMIPFLVCALLLIGPVSAQTKQALPEHHLSISFDINSSQVLGKSLIIIPAGMDAKVYLNHLTITGIKINGAKTDAAEPGKKTLVIKSTGSAQQVEITYEKQFLTMSGPCSSIITPDGISLINGWYPVLDRDTIFYLSARIPNRFEAVSEAKEIITTFSEKEKIQVFRFAHPLNSIHFIAGPYVVEKETFGQGRELYTYFFSEDQKIGQRFREKTLSYLKRYEELIGPYPYKRFSVVENRLPTGFAVPTFTLLGQAVVRLPFVINRSLGHETLHSWFGNCIEIDPAQGNWAEGLTTYLADHAFALDKGRDVAFRKDQLIKYQSCIAEESALTLKNISGVASHLAPGVQADRAVIYSKGSMFFHMLKKHLGEETFFKGIRDFYSGMKHRRAEWNDLKTGFEKAADISLSDIFKQWIERSDIPRLGVSGLKVREKEGLPVLTFSIIQNNDSPYNLEVPVTVRTTDQEIKKLITVRELKTKVEIPLTNLPLEMVIDENYDLMRKLSQSEFPSVWSRFEGASQKLAVIDPETGTEIFKPFLGMLSAAGCETRNADEITDKDLSNHDLIFLGISSKIVRSIFAEPDLPAKGFSVSVRPNPLNLSRVAVLVSATDKKEVEKGCKKLKHYGKYGFLHFINGRIRGKSIPETDMGMRYALDVPPKGLEIPKALSFDDIVEKLSNSRVIYVGETHTRYEDHLLQLRIIRALYNRDPRLAVGMEMFSRATQKALDDYVAHRTDEREFLKESGYFEQWSFDYRNYRDIINFARLHRLPIIALNLEKDTVGKVFKQGGISALTPEEKESIPIDRDLGIPGYAKRISSVFRMHTPPAGQKYEFRDFFQAQALWDETMAESTADFLSANPDLRMVVLAGRGHVVKDSGIPARVARRLPGKQTVVLNTDAGGSIDSGRADFLFFSPPASLSAPPLLRVIIEDTDKGILINKVSKSGGAGKAGIKKNDIILAVDNKSVSTVANFKIEMLFKNKGESVKVLVKRSYFLFPDAEIDFTVEL
ncbi:MAG: ChaN family lipoprotein [Thermodesulfobacteriota bacterium]|nr:ChaN family lipoprotein [Thermodesulfobacteriota bacterium]